MSEYLIFGLIIKLCFAVILATLSAKAIDQCEPGSDLVCCNPCTSTDANCNGTCPDGFTAINKMFECIRKPTSGNVTEDSDFTNNTSLCTKQCAEGVFFDDDNVARCCDSACWNCSAAGSSNCDVCKINYNGTCVDKCPEGFKKVVNWTTNGIGSSRSHEVYVCQKIPVPTDNDKTMLIIMIAAGVGGGVLLIIIIVVICCCCCRRKNGQKRRPISLLVEKKSQQPQNEEGDSGAKPPVGSRPAARRHAYENTALQPSDFGQKVQQQHDVVGRYTRDPTLNVNKNRNKQGRQDADSDYSNSAMVNLHRRIDTSIMSRDELDQRLEEVELAELGQAPTAPQSVNLRKKQSTRRSKVVDPLVKQMRRLSQKFSSKRRQDKVEEPIDYLDMSGIGAAPPPGDIHQEMEGYESVTLGATGSARKQKKALPIPPSKPSPPKTSSKPSRPFVDAPPMESHTELANMETYENTAFGAADDSTQLKKKGAGTKKTETGSKVQADGNNDMEDYANVTENISKRGERTERIKEEEDQEDYENVSELAGAYGSARKPADTGEEDLDDYENVNKKLGVSVEAENKEELQDYENSGQFKKLGESLELYENFESFKKKK